jgi:hypothetical protein
MLKSDLVAVINGIAPVIRDYLESLERAIDDRLAALETAELLAGKDGPPGPAGKDGADGAPGRDGTLDGARLEQVDERTYRLVRPDGSPIDGAVKFASAPLYRGVYDPTTTYVKGDVVTHAGGMWYARDATNERPGDGATKWTLAVKAGRDGREGKPGPQGVPGMQGKTGTPGRSFSS